MIAVFDLTIGRRLTGGKTVRLDKYIADSGEFSRSEAQKLARRGQVAVDGEIARDPSAHVDENTAEVSVCGRIIKWRRFRYVILNKPSGYVSATEDAGPTVMDLLPPEYTKIGLAPCGRLDRDTVGLLLITNDGATTHRLLSPKSHVRKRYRYTLKAPLSEAGAQAIRAGLDLGDFFTKPAELLPESETSGEIVITEGKFHQIKRMFHAVGTEVASLERVAFGPLTLDPALSRGKWRELSADEIAAITIAPESGVGV